MSYYLAIEVKQSEDEIFRSQEGYAREILKRFNIDDANPNGMWSKKLPNKLEERR